VKGRKMRPRCDFPRLSVWSFTSVATCGELVPLATPPMYGALFGRVRDKLALVPSRGVATSVVRRDSTVMLLSWLAVQLASMSSRSVLTFPGSLSKCITFTARLE
jgi:hypothetical protein